MPTCARRNPTQEIDRYLCLKYQGAQPLAKLALLAVVQLFDQIPRLHTAQARTWSQRHLPSYIRELIILFVSQSGNGLMLNAVSEVRLQRISKFWPILFSHHFHNILLPGDLDEKTRNNIVLSLGSGLQTTRKDGTTGTLSIHLTGILSSPAEESLRTHLKYSALLTIFCCRKGATNEMLAMLGLHCPLLQEINVSGSQRVNDVGLASLLGIHHSDLSGFQEPNALAQSLRFAKLRSTGVRVMGIRFLFQYAKNLEGIRCSTNDVLQAMAMELRNTTDSGSQNVVSKVLGLKYLDFSHCFPILSKFVPNLPGLMEVRIGADAPPSMRHSNQRLMSSATSQERQTAQELGEIIQRETLEQIPKLKELKTLVLKDFGGTEALVRLLRTSVGARLSRLDLHYMTIPPHGVNMAILADNCPNLEDLAICDSLVSWEEPRHWKTTVPIFLHLINCKLLRVSYADPFVWEVVPRHATRIRTLNLESCSAMEDNVTDSMLSDGKFQHLEEFQVIGSGHRLTFVTLLRLIANCPKLRWIGDLRDWTLLDSTLVKKSLPNWEGRKQDPREHAQDSMISMNTSKISGLGPRAMEVLYME
eukprot:maker-scaffold259_size234575-snap-gene-0.10 protein:Tk11154 transcript:maker-scaffold259_size234575-snap-gene-0.10-mRNA-1 annotation:"PREDICTED: uncharacterized protein LOC662936"